MNRVMPNGIRYGLGEKVGYIMVNIVKDEVTVTLTLFVAGDPLDAEDHQLDPDLFESVADIIKQARLELQEEQREDQTIVPVPLEWMAIKTRKQ